MIEVKFIKELYPYKAGEVAKVKETVYKMREGKGYFEKVTKEQEPKENKSMANKWKKTKAL